MTISQHSRTNALIQEAIVLWGNPDLCNCKLKVNIHFTYLLISAPPRLLLLLTANPQRHRFYFCSAAAKTLP